MQLLNERTNRKVGLQRLEHLAQRNQVCVGGFVVDAYNLPQAQNIVYYCKTKHNTTNNIRVSFTVNVGARFDLRQRPIAFVPNCDLFGSDD